MIKVAVKIDRGNDLPNWAKKYLLQNNLLQFLQVLKKPRRAEGFKRLVQDPMLAFAESQIYVNAKGEVVFFWPTKHEQSIFLFKWM